MHRRPLFWCVISLLCLLGAGYFWRLGDRWAAEKRHQSAPAAADSNSSSNRNAAKAAGTNAGAAPAERGTNWIAYRLRNTPALDKDLFYHPHAVVLENAVVDTSKPLDLGIPDRLRALPDAGAYIVQTRQPLKGDALKKYRAALTAAGATFVSFVPWNASLERMTEAGAAQMRAHPDTQAVLPWEPVYKLKQSLLKLALDEKPLPSDTVLNAILFADLRADTITSLQQAGAEILAETRSPFGPVVTFRPPLDWSSVARLTGVMEVEVQHRRVAANDLSRARLHVAVNSVVTNNYMDLTGSNVVVNVNDVTGVDMLHPDLTNRVFGDFPTSLSDSNGHGTHVAGTIAGSGAVSATLGTNVQGSVSPAVTGQFRGMAPAANIFAVGYASSNRSDAYLQEVPAQTNALISNNSWNYWTDSAYDLPAASYDAAVRDALPYKVGSQPLMFVFPAGNGGGGNEDGLNGISDTIFSPGTAKNVLTVGAIEQHRSITNVVDLDGDPATTNDLVAVWYPMTDSDFQVASFSSRGNVGLGFEGETGRFKPDVVAPGTFVLSLQSGQFDQAAYYSSVEYFAFTNTVVLPANGSLTNIFFLPDNTYQLALVALPNANSAGLLNIPIFVSNSGQPTMADPVFTNLFQAPPDLPLQPLASDWGYILGNPSGQAVTFDFVIVLGLTNNVGDYFQVLSNMNLALGTNGYYRYEGGASLPRDGTSMAAAGASGVLALIEDLFTNNYAQTSFMPSPALLKGMIINGARSVSSLYDLQVAKNRNFQGWGLVNLANSLPISPSNVLNAIKTDGTATSLKLVDQNPTNALATGESITYFLNVSDSDNDPAIFFPLRFTLVWTDPPGNPAVGRKLVNDLNLVVTNLVTGEVYAGNNIPNGGVFTVPWDPTDTNSTPPVVDGVNNVENVFIFPILSTNYSVTIYATNVNVNAVSDNPDRVAQDFALVISLGDGEITNALTWGTSTPATAVKTSIPQINVTPLTFQNSNAVVASSVVSKQRVGANTPLLGTLNGITNQWHFYVITNTTPFTNQAFGTFLARNLSIPRIGVRENDVANATRVTADVDVYVSTDFALTNLDPVVVANAQKSTSRGGTETIFLTDGTPNQVYYAGVKSEDQMAAEYTFFAVFSQEPFGGENPVVVGAPAAIPDGSPMLPGTTNIFALSTAQFRIRRVVVTNSIYSENLGDIAGTMYNAGLGKSVVLNNHRVLPEGLYNFVYEDNGEELYNTPANPAVDWWVRPTDGPGSLRSFVGDAAFGQWHFDFIDDALTQTGLVVSVGLHFDPENSDVAGGVNECVRATNFVLHSIDVPVEAISLSICISSNTLPLDLYIRRDDFPSPAAFDFHQVITPSTVANCATITALNTPPLAPGRYYFAIYNPNPSDQCYHLETFIEKNLNPVRNVISGSVTNVVLNDDVVNGLYITNNTHAPIYAVDVGLLIQHLRISDLAITLIAPNGKRILLFEDRGMLTPDGLGTLGSIFEVTNTVPIWTNNFDLADIGVFAQPARFQGWNVLSNLVAVTDDFQCLCTSNHILLLGDGAVSNNLPVGVSTDYTLSFKATHAPYLVGMVGWWPFDKDGRDIFGGLDAYVCCNVLFSNGFVNNAYIADGHETRGIVKGCPTIDVGGHRRHSLSVEGWIRPDDITNARPLVEWSDPSNTINPNGVQFWIAGLFTTNGNAQPGTLNAFIWTTNQTAAPIFYQGASNRISTVANALTNAGWQHVALTYDFDSGMARLYTNGSTAAAQTLGQIFPRTTGDLYFGFHPGQSWEYPDFSLTNNYTLTGAATRMTNLIRLTSVTQNQLGALWYNNPQPLGAGFRSKFKFRIANPQLGGADGISFGVQTAGPGANGTEYGAEPAQSVWSISLNTFPNGGLEPSDNFIGILTNSFIGGYAAVQNLNGTGITLSDGNVHEVAVEHTGQFVSVWIDGYQAFTNLYSPIVTGLDTNGMGWVGFGARSGGSSEDHDLLSWTFIGNSVSYPGGLDEFSVYDRALTDCEISAIYRAGRNGKYGTNVLTCPVTVDVDLPGVGTFSFVNGYAWATNGVNWESNFLGFKLTAPLSPTNQQPIIIHSSDPNVAIDQVVLSAYVTNKLQGLLHFTEDTNLAVIPIKFAPTPYIASNFPPVVVFTNDFETVTQAVYAAGSVIPGSFNPPTIGQRDWRVQTNSITVVSNVNFATTGSNWVALARGAVECDLPTRPGRRYELTYTLRGPCAVSWWNGEIEPFSQRARDMISGNHGALLYRATNSNTRTFNGPTLHLPGMITNIPPSVDDIAGEIELGDPYNLHFTNAMTLEGWIFPTLPDSWPTNGLPVQEQLFFRGDLRNCADPYYLALFNYQTLNGTQLVANLRFHIDSGVPNACGVDLVTTNYPIAFDQWQHIAAVYQALKPMTNDWWYTNAMQLYTNGVLITNIAWLNVLPLSYGTNVLQPFQELEPAYSPGVTIGNRSRADASQPYSGNLDEFSAYARALTPPEIKAIADAGRIGKADLRASPTMSLARAKLSLAGIEMERVYAENAEWTTRKVAFTARQTNITLSIESLLPGTLVDGISLAEIPSELYYLPEESLADLAGDDMFGVWKLELWDTRTGASINNPSVLQWQLNFLLTPQNPPPVIPLEHGMPYTNSLPANTVQYFVVNVPQWATLATNVLQFVNQYGTLNPAAATVSFNQTNFPGSSDLALVGPLVTSGSNILSTNGLPPLVIGETYYLAVSNPNPFPITFGLGVWFDLTTLPNCQPIASVVAPAGIPRYFQFDLQTNVQSTAIWVYGAQTNLTLVASDHLPLPDLSQHDYISALADTNNEVVMVLTNSTPFPLRTNRFYVGVYNRNGGDVPFLIQACSTNYPTIIQLTNAVAFDAFFSNTNAAYVAPPGPPQRVFYEFEINDFTDGVLFELYNLSGRADLVLQRYVPPGMAPYMRQSIHLAGSPEQIVLRPTFDMPDLRGKWFLGVNNLDVTNLQYTIRASLPTNGVLVSGQPIVVTNSLLSAGNKLVSWNSVEGERYIVQYSLDGINWITFGNMTAANSCATIIGPCLGPVSWWPGENSAVDIIDGNHGTPVNGATYGPGRFGNAFKFDGIDDTVVIPQAVNLNNFGNQITAECWIYVDPTKPLNVCCSGIVSSDFWKFEVSTGNSPATGVHFDISTDNGASYVHTADANGGGVILPPGVWHHIAGTYDGARLQFYTNGVAAGVPLLHTGPISPMRPASFVTLGSENGRTACPGCINTRYFRGMIDEVAVYNRALSPSEIKALYLSNSKCVTPINNFRVIQTPQTPGLTLPPYRPVTNVVAAGATAIYSVVVPSWATGATNQLLSSSSPVDVVFNQYLTPPASGDFTLLTAATVGAATLVPSGSPSLVPGQRYFLAVRNPGGTPANVVLQVDFNYTELTNGMPINSLADSPPLQRYFYYDVPTNITGVDFQLYNLSGNVDLVARYGTPLPTLGSFDYSSFNPGSLNEDIVVFTNSTPVPLTPGRWYLGVFDRVPGPVSYTIVVNPITNALTSIITLTNAIPYFNTNTLTPSDSDFYRFVVSPNSVRAQFEINNPSGDMTLVARKGLPLPDLALFDYQSANPTTNDELIVVFTNSTPVPLTPGDWFLTAVNVSGGPVNYAIKATEWPVTGQPFIITNSFLGTNSFCITWTSLPGVHYYVEGRPDLDPPWYTASPTLTAVDYTTTFCVPLPTPFHYFRVVEGLAGPMTLPPVVGPPPPAVITGINRAPGGVIIEWTGGTNAQYQLQWSTALPPSWNSFTNIFSSPTGFFMFLDDGSQTGGPDGTRFYRVIPYP